MVFPQHCGRRWPYSFYLLLSLSGMLQAPSCRSFQISSTTPSSSPASSVLSTSSLLYLSDERTVISMNDDDEKDNTVVIVSMDTPARQSLPSHLKLEPIPGKGLGVITKVPIRKNTVVGDYKGEVISTQVKDRRYLPSMQQLSQQLPEDVAWRQSRQERGQSISGTYLYGISMPVSGSSAATVDPIYIDAEDEYNSLWTRFLNHASSMGNNNLNPKSIHESYDGNPRVWFVANRNIQAGEELCFDYGDDYWLPEDHVF